MKLVKKIINPLLSVSGHKLVPNTKGHVYINDYAYSPKPRISFAKSRISKIIDNECAKNKSSYEDIILSFFKYQNNFNAIPLNDTCAPGEPYWNNGWIPVIDAMMIYSTLAARNPRYFVECGSGNTTKFAAKAISDHALRTEIISIDPCPRADIDILCKKIYRMPFEDMDLTFFSQLTADDIFLVDNSHRAFSNSDVTVFFTEVLPELPAGLIYAIHDIALPDEVFCHRYYNEQYMLATYIIGGAMGDKIHFPTAYISTHTNLLDEVEIKLSLHPELKIKNIAGFFWMQKA